VALGACSLTWITTLGGAIRIVSLAPRHRGGSQVAERAKNVLKVTKPENGGWDLTQRPWLQSLRLRPRGRRLPLRPLATGLTLTLT